MTAQRRGDGGGESRTRVVESTLGSAGATSDDGVPPERRPPATPRPSYEVLSSDPPAPAPATSAAPAAAPQAKRTAAALRGGPQGRPQKPADELTVSLAHSNDPISIGSPANVSPTLHAPPSSPTPASSSPGAASPTSLLAHAPSLQPEPSPLPELLPQPSPAAPSRPPPVSLPPSSTSASPTMTASRSPDARVRPWSPGTSQGIEEKPAAGEPGEAHRTPATRTRALATRFSEHSGTPPTSASRMEHADMRRSKEALTSTPTARAVRSSHSRGSRGSRVSTATAVVLSGEFVEAFGTLTYEEARVLRLPSKPPRTYLPKPPRSHYHSPGRVLPERGGDFRSRSISPPRLHSANVGSFLPQLSPPLGLAGSPPRAEHGRHGRQSHTAASLRLDTSMSASALSGCATESALSCSKRAERLRLAEIDRWTLTKASSESCLPSRDSVRHGLWRGSGGEAALKKWG